ncbi:MAG TPA: hypothetical protein VM889_02915 [Candidatus Thermoplasmatota archaeon]|nr:hypothetical protein [Candidatus Thermoplasmatota archaeon]
MDQACKFGLEYQPPEQAPDPALLAHVRHCVDCQGQVVVVEATTGLSWSFASAP